MAHRTLLYASAERLTRPGRAKQERAGNQERARLSEQPAPLPESSGLLAGLAASSEGEGHSLTAEHALYARSPKSQLRAY